MNSTGDQFFLPDSSQFYFDALQGEKYLRYVPNTDHGIDSDPGAIQDFVAYYGAYLNGTPKPEFSWTKQTDGSLHVQTVTTPTTVRIWQAANTTARDFRLETIGAVWTSTDLTDQGGGLYIGQIPAPAEGWAAFLVELEFPSGGPYPFHFTTEVSVIPDTLPNLDHDEDGMLDSWEFEHMLDPTDPFDALYDPDDDGVNNLQEYLDGTDPQNPESKLPLAGTLGLIILTAGLIAAAKRHGDRKQTHSLIPGR